jgi:hypothetical protein
MTIVLDGRGYTAVEDENDGYRSAMGELLAASVSELEGVTHFPGVAVLCSLAEDGHVLEIRERAKGRLVARVGTASHDDYYPCFLREWTPENI